MELRVNSSFVYTKQMPEYRLRNELMKSYILSKKISRLIEFKSDMEFKSHILKKESVELYYKTYVKTEFPWEDIEMRVKSSNEELTEKYKKLMEARHGSKS